MASIDKKALQAKAALTDTTVGEKASLEKRQRKFVGVIVVSACNAATTVTGKIEHSHDGESWFDLLSFAAIAGTTGKEAVHVNESTAHVMTYVRSSVTLAGVAKAATVEVNLCFEQ